MTVTGAVSDRHQIWVWFGEHLLAQYTADAEVATRYAVAMNRRYCGVLVTTEPIGPGSAPASSAELPCQRLWSTTTK
jgi:hypothetical protein